MCPTVKRFYISEPFNIRNIQVFHSLYKVGRNGIIGIKGFKYSKKLPPVGLNMMQKIITGLRV